MEVINFANLVANPLFRLQVIATIYQELRTSKTSVFSYSIIPYCFFPRCAIFL